LNICKTPGTKIVPFIPVIDANLEFWFKKDSLWYCENKHYDSDNVIILQSPVSVKYITSVNEPISDFITTNINLLTSIVDETKELYYKPYIVNHTEIKLTDFNFDIMLSKNTTIDKYVDYYKHLFKNSTQELSIQDEDIACFVKNTQISTPNAAFGFLCARSVSYVFNWIIHTFKFNPNGVIHIYQYFEKFNEPEKNECIQFNPCIQNIQYKGNRSELTIKTTFIQNNKIIGYTISCFGIFNGIRLCIFSRLLQVWTTL
jgi:hypothetical protein